ncbi:MAG: DUF167 domain-containing protein [Candidatus Helarchaeota archaeon]
MNKILNIHVNPNSKEVSIKEIGNNIFEIKLKSPPLKGKANKELIEVLSEYFKVKKSKISILRGKTSKNKIIMLEI